MLAVFAGGKKRLQQSPLPVPDPPLPGNADADWVIRSTALGVVYSNALDTLDKINGGYTNGVNGRRVTHDTTTKVLSGGSMRFDLLAGETGDDISGNWVPGTTLDPNGFKHVFGQNSDMYVQFRCRLSGSMYTNLINHWKTAAGHSIWPGWKISVIYAPGSGVPCASIEVTITAGNGDGDRMYTHCGERHARTQTTSPNHTQNVPYLSQSGWDLVTGLPEPNAYPHRTFDDNNNDRFPVDAWFTIYQKVHIGTWGSANSTIEMWIQRSGENFWKKMIAVRNYTLNHDGNANTGFGRIMLTPYMTGLARSAPEHAYMWFSELIVSTQPIGLA